MVVSIVELAAPLSGSVPHFDAERAASLARSLDALADLLDHAADTEIARYPSSVADWAGFTRRWFDHQQHGLIAELRRAAISAREEALLVITPRVRP